jgi:peptidoglycan/LPS O-acetylase OafA/YrhL
VSADPVVRERATEAGAAPLTGTGRPDHFRRDIEGLRALAVGLVVADHVFGWPAGGFVGVDVFFVISGFLITGLLVRERSRTGRISFGGFYARRVRRLFPAALAALAATTVAAWLVFLGGRFQETLTDVVWAALFGANINFARQGTDYFGRDAPPSLVQHFWSLSVEEQFYVAWPALILLAFAVAGLGRRRRASHAAETRRSPTLAMWAVLGTVTAASFAWSVHATAVSPATAYFSTLTRAWELGVGALIAVTAAYLDRVPAVLRAALAWCGLAAVVVAAVAMDDGTPFPGTAAALPVLGAAALVAFGSTPGGPGARWLLGSAPARFVGAISYSLYLWHWPVLGIAAALVLPGSLLFELGVVAVSLVLATASYYCIEQPVLHTNWLLPHRPVDRARARAVFRRAAVVGAGAVVLTAATVVALVTVPQGEGGSSGLAAARAAAEDADGSPLTPLQQDIRAATLATEWPVDLDPAFDQLPTYSQEVWPRGCLSIERETVEACSAGDPGAARRVTVVGDSYAAAWVPALQHELVPQGWYVENLSYGICPNVTATPVFGVPFTACTEHREWALERILQDPPELVVLAHSWRADLVDVTDKAAAYHDGLADVVRRVQASGARVVVLGAPPGSGNLMTCATALNGPDDCLRGPAGTFDDQVESEREVAAETGARAIDPEQWFCIDDLCPAVVGRTPVYFDGHHLTAEYARLISPEVVTAILRP